MSALPIEPEEGVEIPNEPTNDRAEELTQVEVHRMFKAYRRALAEIEENNQVAETQIAELRDWQEDVNKGLLHSVRFLEERLRLWHQARYRENPKKYTTVKLPGGGELISFDSGKKSVEIFNEELLIAKGPKELVRPGKPQAQTKTEILKWVEAHEGELPPGVNVKSSERTFNVKVTKQKLEVAAEPQQTEEEPEGE